MRRRVLGALLFLIAALGIASAEIISVNPIGGGTPVGGSCTTVNALLKRGGDTTIACSAVIDASGALSGITTLAMSGQLTSTLATGTPPFSIASTTLVPNLYVARSALADTVTTNANLTGPITSTGNATAIASQTGTGTKFVVDTSPTLVTPVLGVATATSIGLSVGATGSPSLFFAGSPTTGLYLPFANYIGFTSAGTTVATINQVGLDIQNAFVVEFVASHGGSANLAVGRLANAALGVGSTSALTDNTADIGTTSQRVKTVWAATSFNAGSGKWILNGSGTAFATTLTAASGTPHTLCIDATTHEITENAALTCTVSSARFKTDIRDQGAALPLLAALHPRQFRMRGSADWRVGLVAEEVETVDPRLVSYDRQGRPHSVRYEDIVSVLVQANHELRARVEALERRGAAN